LPPAGRFRVNPPAAYVRGNPEETVRTPWLLAAAVFVVSAPLSSQQFRIEEATIAQLHQALLSRAVTCRAVVDQYLARIEAYDKQGPAINAIVSINPEARTVADSLDRRFAREGLTGPLHCVTVIVKENMETVELPTTAGSLALQGFRSRSDAFQVKRMKEAGAVVLAKANMAELAFSPYETVSSILPGYTRNPYSIDRVTAGSSGGTAAAVAASFGLVGLGTDTGNSIRGPSAHQALVGIRSTMGLTSRGGIVPLNLAYDIAGPITRTMEDAVRVFQVIVGEDPDDPATAAARGRAIPPYASALDRNGLRGARIGVLTQAYLTPTTDPEVQAVFGQALADLRKAGATVLDSMMVDSLAAWRRAQTGNCSPFKRDLEAWLARQGDRVPVKSLDQLIESNKFHPSILSRLQAAERAGTVSDTSAGCRSREEFRARLRAGVLELMERHRLDALVYPTWSNPPRLIGDLNTPHGDNNQLFSPATGFPALTVPMGWLRNRTLPSGLQFFGRPWDESRLIRLAYGYEQATRHRRPPALERAGAGR
jgi:Asp-tRNA(Asn)/Glu-tRNA(Gln) amidotransferase A subunit family amidase